MSETTPGEGTGDRDLVVLHIRVPAEMKRRVTAYADRRGIAQVSAAVLALGYGLDYVETWEHDPAGKLQQQLGTAKPARKTTAGTTTRTRDAGPALVEGDQPLPVEGVL